MVHPDHVDILHEVVFFGPHRTSDVPDEWLQGMPDQRGGIEPTAAIVPTDWLEPFIGQFPTPHAIQKLIRI